MPARWLALLFVLALLPTVELVEQGTHVVEHVLAGEAAGHDAHHEERLGDEHGCTALVHLCGAHQGIVVMPRVSPPLDASFESRAPGPSAPADLHDHAAREPAHRPPIA